MYNHYEIKGETRVHGGMKSGNEIAMFKNLVQYLRKGKMDVC